MIKDMAMSWTDFTKIQQHGMGGGKKFSTIYDNPANTTQFKEVSTVTSLQNLILSWSYKYNIHFHTHSTSLNVSSKFNAMFPRTVLQHDCLIMEQQAPSLARMRPYQTCWVLHCAVFQHCPWKHRGCDMSLTVTSLSVPQKKNQWNLDWFLQYRLILSFAKNNVHS